LNKEITIGHVAASICEKSLFKNNRLPKVFQAFVSGNISATIGEDEEQLACFSKEFLSYTHTSTATADSPVGTKIKKTIHLYITGWKKAIVFIPTFFIF